MIKVTPSSCRRPSRSPNMTSPATSGMAGKTLDTAAVSATWPDWPPRENASSPTTSVRPAAVAQIMPDVPVRQALLRPQEGQGQ